MKQSKKPFQQKRDVYSSMPQEQRPANMPPSEEEMEVVQDQEEQSQKKRRRNNPNNSFVRKHG